MDLVTSTNAPYREITLSDDPSSEDARTDFQWGGFLCLLRGKV